MKTSKTITYILFFISCTLLVLPFWIDLFGQSGFDFGSWVFDFHIVMLCLVNVINSVEIDSKIFKISIISLVIVLLSLVLISVSSTEIISKIGIALKGSTYLVMIFYFYKMILSSTKKDLSISNSRLQ